MKSYSIKVLIVSLMVSGIAAITSCKDDNLIDPSTNTPPLLEKEMKISRINHFYKIDIPGESEWHVTHSPKWIGLLNRKGSAGERLQIFVQTNGEDNDRRDTIVVALADENSVRFPIHQLCEATDEENFEAGQIDDGDLKMTYGVGYGVDVIKPGDFLSYKYNVSNNSPFNFASLYNAINDLGEYDAMFDEPLYSSRFESVTGSSTSAMANQLGVNAGIEVGIKAFKFSVEAGYEKKSDSNERNMYAIQEVQHIVGSRYVRAGVLRYLAQNADTVLQETFRQCIEDLREDPSDKEAMQTIIDRYGTHIVTHGTLGGELKISLKMKVTSECDGSKIHAALGLSSKVVNVNGSFDMSDDEKQAASNTTFSLQAYGGRNVYSVAPGATFDSIMVKIKDPKLMNAWVSAIKNDSALALIDMQTMPIWDLMPTEALRDTLRNFVVNDYQRKIYGANFKPDLYRISGYDVNIEAPGRDSIYIPELDLAIVAERYICKDLSEDEFSTIIHSGPQGNVNYDRGFFVGSDTRLPCKIHRLKDNTLEKEVFDHITKTSAVETLYADASGDITIATKSVDGMYMTTNFNHWVHDLGMLNKEWEVTSNVTVTGTTNYPVTIADGVTLTLDNATINNQIICNGNANIVLKDGTANSVAQGIVNGGEGSTLTINGGGSLTATGKDSYPGIGNGKGNIVISGGTVKATGSAGSAGIGAGQDGHCGNITIAQDAKGVTATCGNGEDCVPIGVGDGDSSCGSVILESRTNVVQNDPNILDISGFTHTITIDRNRVITGTTNQLVDVEPGVRVTLANAHILNTLSCEWSNEIRLRDNTTNLVHGIIGGGSGIIISGGGFLTTKGQKSSPGIEVMEGSIMIKGGEIDAIGGEGAAGIGSRQNNKCGNIIISGGMVNAKGGKQAAGIGSGLGGTCGAITISGGSVISKGSSGAACIGSGRLGSVSRITISGGDVTTYISVGKELTDEGVGIGSGFMGACGNITIEGGKVEAHASQYGPGIGYGVSNTGFGDIVISGGKVNARGGMFAAGIGSGFNSQCGNITIYKTVEEVYARPGTGALDAIGRGKNSRCGTVTIEEGANVIQ